MASDNNANNEPLPEEDVKSVVDTWIDLAKIPTVGGAYILEDDNFLNVVTKWAVTDIAKKDGVCFARTYSVLKSSLESGNPIISTPGPVTVDEKLSIVAKSGKKKAVLVEKSGDGDAKTEYLQIWDQNTLLKTYNLGELDLHKSVYTHAGWGITMAWSKNENKLAYLAEKKVLKAKSFYTTATAPKPKEESEKKDDKEKPPIGEEFVLKQTWGEKLTSQYFSVIVVLDIESNEFKVLPLPDDQFPTDIQWVCDTYIVGTSYPIPIWRLGLMACSNRESVIFSVQADGENFRTITEAGKACRSPRVRPDGGYLVWQERILDGAHDRARAINGVALNEGQPSGQPCVIYESAPQNGMPVYQDFFRNCWSTDGNTLFVVTPNEGTSICLAITVGPPVQVTKIERVDSLLWITKDYLLVSSSTTLTSPQLNLLCISESYKPVAITQAISPIEFQTLKELVYGEASPPSIFYGPAITSVAPNSVPMVVVPHGGPHGGYVDSFSLGFGVLRLNYIGGTGGNRDTADELLGKVGDRDVKDCQGMVEKILNSIPSLNPNQVGVFGGSHGGYLACHLSSAYPDAYKAAVALNPVTDFGTMVGTSDIADWVYAEAGVALPNPPQIQTLIPTARNLQDAEKFIKHRPFIMLIKVRVYPDNHSLLKPAVELDFMIHSALWLKRYVR
ncbi:Acylamino-acid-releasing enzyme [Orchesella cincta]|uniref:acylaminoacyl-peptidase n=1 Tax=Orchesella cincta TaxID=48709 RepID=A0A1D2MDJ1_ORCCI|nr:Acylamino-acid-releasing enzyme [Orchesella cincta]